MCKRRAGASGGEKDEEIAQERGKQRKSDGKNVKGRKYA